jgi:hypothetical protein
MTIEGTIRFSYLLLMFLVKIYISFFRRKRRIFQIGREYDKESKAQCWIRTTEMYS